MKTIFARTFFLGISVFSGAVMACDAGLTAFESSVYAKVRRDCAGCHDGTIVAAPPFAVADPFKSYSQLINYVSFSDPNNSLLTIRAGNNHCKISLCQANSGVDMATQVAAWWNGGQRTCQDTGQYVSPALPLPTFPATGSGNDFALMSFDLSGLKPELRGISLQIEIEDYMAPSAQTKGSYRFRSPRVVGGAASVYIKGLKILLDGAYAPTSNNYFGIDRTFPFFTIADPVQTATSILSGDQIMIVKDGQAHPTISVSFVDIGTRTTPPACANPDGYVSQIKPLVNAFACIKCHQPKGATIGEKVLDLTSSDLRACQTMGSLMDPNYLMLSAAIKVPAQGIMTHPQLTDVERDRFVSAIKKWQSPAQK